MAGVGDFALLPAAVITGTTKTDRADGAPRAVSCLRARGVYWAEGARITLGLSAAGALDIHDSRQRTVHALDAKLRVRLPDAVRAA